MDNNIEILGSLYIVPTPIGNLEDITFRSLKTLNSVDIIACEDTRETSKLLNHYKINGKTLESYHEHNEETKNHYLLSLLKSGKKIALVSDAGTPTVSDPGYKLVRLCLHNGINVVPLPGASAMLTALTASGLPTDKFTFFGFPPQKKGRSEFLKSIANHPFTSIIYESPHKILDFVGDLAEILEESREICIARELTKKFEEIFLGTISEAKEFLAKKDRILGEFVVILSGKEKDKMENNEDN